MQTFLPFSSFAESASVLDRQRLGKQRSEVLTILRVLAFMKRPPMEQIAMGRFGWVNHPAVLMWRNNPQLLGAYGWHICQEWVRRGYKDTCLDKISRLVVTEFPTGPEASDYAYGVRVRLLPKPTWLGDEAFHRSHQSNLLRKDPEYYGKFGWDVPPDLPYVWPSV